MLEAFRTHSQIARYAVLRRYLTNFDARLRAYDPNEIERLDDNMAELLRRMFRDAGKGRPPSPREIAARQHPTLEQSLDVPVGPR